jgi:hypothetical protein
MSYAFDIDGRTVWSPALRIGLLYVRMAGDLSEFGGGPHGLSPQTSDTYDIDVAVFSSFVRSLLTDSGTGHPIYCELTRGFVAISLAMLERAGAPMVDEAAQALSGLTIAVAASMPDL